MSDLEQNAEIQDRSSEFPTKLDDKGKYRIKEAPFYKNEKSQIFDAYIPRLGIEAIAKTSVVSDNEAKLLAGKDMPYLPIVYGAPTYEGKTYMITEKFSSKDNLQGILLRNEQLNPEDIYNIIGGLCHAVNYLNLEVYGSSPTNKAIRHRDIRSANIYYKDRKIVKLADLDISSHSNAYVNKKERIALGTPGYMAPETLYGHEENEVSDVYSLGVLAYELVTGENPFQIHRNPNSEGDSYVNRMTGEQLKDETLSEKRLERLITDAKKKGIQDPENYAKAVVNATRKTPQNRTQTAAQFFEEITPTI